MKRISLRMFITLDGNVEFPNYPGQYDVSIYPDTNFTYMWHKYHDSIGTIILEREA